MGTESSIAEKLEQMATPLLREQMRMAMVALDPSVSERDRATAELIYNSIESWVTKASRIAAQLHEAVRKLEATLEGRK